MFTFQASSLQVTVPVPCRDRLWELLTSLKLLARRNLCRYSSLLLEQSPGQRFWLYVVVQKEIIPWQSSTLCFFFGWGGTLGNNKTSTKRYKKDYFCELFGVLYPDPLPPKNISLEACISLVLSIGIHF